VRFGAIVSFWNWNKSDQISVKAVASANASTSGAEEPASREVASKSFVLAVHEGNENVFTETSDSGLTLAGGSEGVELLACRFLGDDFEDDLDQKSLKAVLLLSIQFLPVVDTFVTYTQPMNLLASNLILRRDYTSVLQNHT